MKTKLQFPALALAALLTASCSQDSALFSDVEVEKGSVSLNISLDQNLGSRAGETADELPSRCLLEVYEGVTGNIVGKQIEAAGSTTFSFTVSNLEKGKDYTFVFWADAGAETFDTSSLKSVTAKSDNHIAFTGKATVKSGTSNVAVTLRHAVAKMSVVHSDASVNLAVGDNVAVEFTRKQYAFNTQTQTYTATSDKKEAITATITADKVSGELVSRYMLAPNDEMAAGADKSMMVSDFKLGYKANGATEMYYKSIPSVTFKANHRTVISGNIKNLSLEVHSFTVSLNTDWTTIVPDAGNTEEPTEPDEPDNPDPVGPDEPDEPVIPPTGSTITLTTSGSLTAAQISSALGSGNSFGISGPMNDDDFKTVSSYLKENPTKEVNLDLSGADMTAIPDDAFYQCGNLIGIVLSNKITSIGVYSFAETGLTEVSAIDVTMLDQGAFKGCPNLEKATLGNIKNIDIQIFYNCPKLTTLDLSRCEAAFEAKDSFFSSGQSLTIYVKNNELMDAFQEKWKSTNSRYNITWAIK